MEMQPDEDKVPAQPAGESSEPPRTEAPEGAAPAAGQTRRPNADEALAEMRRSLREEEKQEKTGFRASLKRLTSRLFRRKAKTPEESEAVTSEEGLQLLDIPSRLDMPAATKEVRQPPRPSKTAVESAPPPEAVPAPTPETRPAEFGALVRNKLTEAFETKEEIQPPTPAHSILASIRPEQPEAEPDTSSFRQEALEDYVLTPEEPEEEGRRSLARSIRRSWRDMRPVERRLLIGALLIVGVAMLIGSGFLVVKSRVPTATPTPTLSTLPYPITVSLPGGWVFPLRTGFVQNGKWDPLGPEWLQGTEICRWVSLPWSLQLEAVVRTLKADDEIRLSMSNYDSLVYKVKSIEQVPSSQLANLAPNTPSLLLILSKKDSDIRWVVTAMP